MGEELTVVVDPTPGLVIVVVAVEPGPFFVIVVVDPGPFLVICKRFSISLHVLSVQRWLVTCECLSIAMKQPALKKAHIV